MFFMFNFSVVVLESRPTQDLKSPSNLYILTGHENSYWKSHANNEFVMWYSCDKLLLLLPVIKWCLLRGSCAEEVNLMKL